MTALQVGGITLLTTIDFPGELAAVVFCQGCPWQYRYCQSPHLLPSSPRSEIAWQEVLDLLQRLIDLLAERGVAEITLQRYRTQHVFAEFEPDVSDDA